MDNQWRIVGPAYEPNVHGWERAGSILSGLLMARHGYHRGGLSGLWSIGLGAALLLRGLTGHCYVKEVLHDRGEALRHLRDDLERLQRAVDKLAKESATKAPQA
ncbi:YgaP-like transmembrane domain [Pseudomonas sp. GCM10022186]|uniref:YgaP-like transmembrane domain n=1 Tax=Pseudomonas sp. GCM10022186 TaxID=3252650 RepID=UPI00361B97C0